MELTYLLFGLGGLWLGTELVVKGALAIARHYNVSQVFIGLTILAIGTDLPELVVAIDASIMQLKGLEASGLIIGNAIGSSLNLITMVLGIGGVVGYLTLSRKSIKKDGLVLLGVIVMFFLVSFDGRISRIDGISLLVVYLIYCLMLLYGEKVSQKLKTGIPKKIWEHLIYLVGGLVLVVMFSDIVVTNSIVLAERWGVSQSFIAIVFIAVGTSLPELAISIGAVIKKSPGLSVGNIIGSNIFNLLVPVGIGAVLSDLKVESNLLYRDIPFLFMITVMVLIFLSIKKGLQKKEAGSLVAVYLLYLVAKTFGF